MIAKYGPETAVYSHTDTFWSVQFGRLKLREQQSSHDKTENNIAEVTTYHRTTCSSSSTSRHSACQRLPVADVAGTKALFDVVFHRLLCVHKRRHCWLLNEDDAVGHVRVHLDDVDGLGTFVKVEVGIKRNENGAAMRRVEEWRTKLMGILSDECMLNCAYVTQAVLFG